MCLAASISWKCGCTWDGALPCDLALPSDADFPECSEGVLNLWKNTMIASKNKDTVGRYGEETFHIHAPWDCSIACCNKAVAVAEQNVAQVLQETAQIPRSRSAAGYNFTLSQQANRKYSGARVTYFRKCRRHFGSEGCLDQLRAGLGRTADVSDSTMTRVVPVVNSDRLPPLSEDSQNLQARIIQATQGSASGCVTRTVVQRYWAILDRVGNRRFVEAAAAVLLAKLSRKLVPPGDTVCGTQQLEQTSDPHLSSLAVDSPSSSEEDEQNYTIPFGLHSIGPSKLGEETQSSHYDLPHTREDEDSFDISARTGKMYPFSKLSLNSTKSPTTTGPMQRTPLQMDYSMIYYTTNWLLTLDGLDALSLRSERSQGIIISNRLPLLRLAEMRFQKFKANIANEELARSSLTEEQLTSAHKQVGILEEYMDTARKAVFYWLEHISEEIRDWVEQNDHTGFLDGVAVKCAPTEQ